MKFLDKELKHANRDFLIFFNKLFLAVSGKGDDDPIELVKYFARDHCEYLFWLLNSLKTMISRYVESRIILLKPYRLLKQKVFTYLRYLMKKVEITLFSSGFFLLSKIIFCSEYFLSFTIMILLCNLYPILLAGSGLRDRKSVV